MSHIFSITQDMVFSNWIINKYSVSPNKIHTNKKWYVDEINRVMNEQASLLLNQLPDDKILDWFKLKQIADEISKSI